MNFQQLNKLMEQVSKKKVGIIGDCCLDVYWHADMTLSELSLETPEFPLPIVKENYYLGAGGNIVNNLATLGLKEIHFITVLGDDWRGHIVLDLLSELECVNTESVIMSKDRCTSAYCKPIRHGISEVVYEDARLDFWNLEKISTEIENNIIHHLHEMAQSVDIIIVEDQLKDGMITNKIRHVLSDLGKTGKTIIVDSRYNGHQYQNVLLKPNEKELLEIAQKSKITTKGKHTVAIAQEISQLLNNQVVVTLGDKGSIWITKDGICQKEAIAVKGEIDIVGAGDGFISGLASFYGIANKEEILRLCNLISSIVIKKIGITGSASQKELLKKFVLEYETPYFEKVTPFSDMNIKCVLFDFDGTISTLRHGWERIMFDYVYEQLSSYYKGREKTLTSKIRGFIHDTTGIQTIFQMQWIVEEVKKAGGKPLDQWEYKDGYNEALLKMVRERVAKLLRGELKPVDFRVPGSKEFIEMLVKKGIKCYIASGTDDIDIKKEMQSIEVNGLFEDSKGAPTRKIACPKEAMYRKLTEDLGYRPNEIMVVGDGKVEINLGVTNGSLTLGVACDEFNLKEIDLNKRNRLIGAQAHAIITDFKDSTSIIQWMLGDEDG